MALAYYQDLGVDTAPFYEATPRLSIDETVHLRNYRKFVFFARIAACIVPFFMAFVLYWTT